MTTQPIEPRLVRIVDPDHRYSGRVAHAEAVYLLGDWTEVRYRLRLADGTVSSAALDEIRELPPEITE